MIHEFVHTFEVNRLKNNGDTTIGKMDFVNGLSFHTLEDEHRTVKVAGETRIPFGVYELAFREELTPLTKVYRERHDFFKWHLELKNVPGFTGIYIHPLNNDDQTEGCIGIGYQTGNWKIWESVKAYRDFYMFCLGFFDFGGRIYVIIRDKDR